MMRDGWAFTFVRYLKRNIEDEAAAHAVMARMFNGPFVEA
jgi:hypothetical protein